MNREAIYSAVFSRLQTVAGFVTVSRRLRHWSDVTAQEMPYVCMVQKRESVDGSRKGLPLRWTMHMDFVLYGQQQDHTLSPMVIMNPLVDAVCNAFLPDAVTGTVTLNGSVYHSRINGDIESDEGALGSLAVIIIPFMINTPE